MLVTKTSLWSGKTHTMDLDITPAQVQAWQQGQVIQNAMPHLTKSEREFLISGLTPDEWQELSSGLEDI